MTKQRLPAPTIANSSDYSEISICFEDQQINVLFSQLLEVRGFKTQILSSISEFRGDTKIVTEPRFFDSIDVLHRSNCLVVGNREALRGSPAHSLARPLTEEKIESAIDKFLSS